LEINEGFEKIRTYLDSLYTLTIAGTGNWGEALLAELLKYQKTIDAQTKAAKEAQSKLSGGVKSKSAKGESKTDKTRATGALTKSGQFST
jgi:predicted dinucleotide-binding enzyme